MLNMGRWRPC